MKVISNIAGRLFHKVQPAPSANSESKRDASETTAPAFCAIDCPGRCPLVLHLRDGELTRVSANKAAPACHRGLSMRAWANSPDRLMWPMRRVGPRGSTQFERVSWDDALNTVASELSRIRREYGNEAIYMAYTTGQSCTTADPFERLMNCFDGFLDHYNNYSNPQINAMVRSLYGPGALYPGGSDLDVAADAQLVLVFGASPAETGTGRATWHGAWDRVVKRVGERGGRIVMVDPRHNGSIPKQVAAPCAQTRATTACGGETGRSVHPSQTANAFGSPVAWLPINPGTDGALVAALLHELAFTHNALDWDFLRERCIGFTDETLPERWRGKGLSVVDYLRGTGYDCVAKTPAWAARITDVDESEIKALAQQLATTRPIFVMQGWGPQRRSNGEMTSGMIMLLALALGQVGLPGTNNGMNVAWGGGFLTHVSAGENPIPFRIPAYRFLDAIENGSSLSAREGVQGLTKDSAIGSNRNNGSVLERTTNSVQQPEEPHLPSSIKAIICHGGNCLTNQHGDVNRAHRVLADPAQCEFILNIDVEFTDSARYADIVLPDLFRLEQVSVMDADTWGRRVEASDGVLGTRFERRGGWDICGELAKRWGVESAFAESKTEAAWARTLYEADRKRDSSLPPFEQLLEQGVCFREGTGNKPFVSLADWRRNPTTYPLDTPSGKVEIFSEQLASVAAALRGTPDEGTVTPIPTYVPEWGPAEFGVGGACVTTEHRQPARTDSPRDPANEHTPCDQPLRAFGFHSIARIHSSWGNVPAVSSRVPQVISINPADAAVRGIRTGDLLEASNRFGTLRLPAHVTDEVIAGTIVMPQGAWWKAVNEDDADSNSASENGSSSVNPVSDAPNNPVDVGGCINTLTSSRPSPLAFGNPQHTCWCHVRKA